MNRWVGFPSPLAGLPRAPNKEPVSLDPKMFDTGEGGPTVCLEQKGVTAVLFIQVQGLGFQ